MKQWSKRVRLLWLVCLPAMASAAGTDSERTLKRSFPLTPAQSVRLDLRWGELEIEPTGGDQVELVLTADCREHNDTCADRLADIDIVADQNRDRLDIEVIGLSRWGHSGGSLRLVARVPRQRALGVDMGAGEVTVEGFGSDLEVDLGAGEIRVRMPENAVQRVDLSAGVGEATLHRADGDVESERAHLIGSSVRWEDGSGDARVDCRVGAGEVDVRLE